MIDFEWVKFSSPVGLWWIFLISASIVNIFAWSWTRIYLYRNISIFKFKFSRLVPENLIWFSGAYVFGCAYRSFFIKADVQRICVFDSWLSSVFLGRTVATVAEICFVAQWAIVLRYLSIYAQVPMGKKISYFLVPLIIIAECFSWYAVIRTDYLGNMIEESLWAITYFLVAVGLIGLRPKFKGAFKYAINLAIIFDFIYVAFMIFVDVSMYYYRWQVDLHNQKKLLGFFEGIRDLNTRWIVTHDINLWRSEIPWMSLYFSFAVIVSIILCYVPLHYKNVKKHLKRHYFQA